MGTQQLTSERIDFENAASAIEYYFDRGWTDGLPVVPPTIERVAEFVEYAGRSPSEIIGTEPTKGRVITVEKVAINSLMAGCLPEYFPVVLAAVQAICEPRFNLHGITASTMGAAVLIVVNGPIAKEIGVNSGISVFGPGHRANATIGRAIRLVIINVTGSVSGIIDKATLGHAGKYTWCIAESEDVSPWEPLHIERGISSEKSSVSVFAGLSPTQVSNHEGHHPEAILASFKDALFAAGPDQGEIILTICPEHVGYFEEHGWTKDQVRQFLYETTQRSNNEWAAAGKSISNDVSPNNSNVGVLKRPDSATIVVAGGAAGAFSNVIPIWGAGLGSQSVTREIGQEVLE